MPLKVSEVSDIMENYAPTKLKESYDNVGLMVGDLSAEVTNILVALDCTLEVIEEAKNNKCNLILTHHPLLFFKPSSITTETLMGRKIIELIKNDINLYSSHTNLDSVSCGLNDMIMDILGFGQYETIEPSHSRESLDKSSGIGRIVSLKESTSLKEVCKKVKTSLNIPFLRYTGSEDWIIKKIAVINGSGEDFFSKAKKMGADCIITGDTTYHYASDYTEEGIAIIDAGHFETEWPTFKMFGKLLEKKLQVEGYENKVFISENTSRVYKFK